MQSLSAALRVFAHSSWFRFIFFAGLIICAVLHLHAGKLMPLGNGVPLSAPLSVVAEHFGQSDYATYAKGAVVLRDQGLRAYADLGFKNFAPGISFLQRIILFFSEQAPLPLCMLVLAILLWAAAFTFLSHVNEEIIGLSPAASIAVTASVLVAPFLNTALLWDGVLISESLSTPIFIIGFLSAFRILLANESIGWRRVVFTALVLVVAAFLRAQYDILFIVLALLLGAVKLFACSAFGKKMPSLTSIASGIGRGLLGVLVVYLLVTTPYRIFISSPFMVVNNYVWKLIWHDRAFFEQNGGGFILSGGGGVICETNPETCASFMAREKEGPKLHVGEAKIAAILTVARSPISYFSKKIPYFYDNWMGDFAACPSDVGCEARDFNRPMLFLFPFVPMVLAFRGKKERRGKNLALYTLTFVGVTAGALGFSIFIHVEPRYMLPIKLMVFWSEAAVLGCGADWLVKRLCRARLRDCPSA